MHILRNEQEDRRRKTAMRVAAAIMVLVTLGGIFGWQLYRKDQAAKQQAREAEQERQEAQGQLAARYVEQGRQELSQGQTLRALPYLSAAYAIGNPSSELRFMLARAMQPVDALLATLRHYRDRGLVHSVTFSPDGTRVFTADEEGTVAVLGPGKARGPGRNLGHKIEKQVMAVSADCTQPVT